MPNRSRPLVVFTLLVALAGCLGHGRPPYDPFRVPRYEVGATLQVVALAPMDVPRDLENAELVKGRFLATIEARLRAGGIAVLPTAETGPLIQATMESRGGFFDATTGRLDLEKLRAARDEALGGLRARFGRVDGIVFVQLRVVPVTVVHDSASWDHTNEWAATSGWKSILNKHSGVLPALSLVLRVTGARGADLYADTGGIKLLQKIDVGGNLIPVPQGEALGDEQRNAAAVDLAVGDLLVAIREARAGAPAPSVPAAAPVPVAAPPPTPAPAPASAPPPSPAAPAPPTL